jgi:FkbM family methyltransferase
MTNKIESEVTLHTFRNGIRVSKADLTEEQLTRYSAHATTNVHEPVEEYWFLKALEACSRKTGFRYLDIGAAVGYYCVLVRKTRPDALVVACDPNPFFTPKFWNTLDLNRINSADLTHLEVAVFPHSAQIELQHKGFGTHYRQTHQQLDDATFTAPARDLCDIVQEYGPFDLCKIDIQTAELPVLTHALPRLKNNQIRWFIVGTHGHVIHERIVALFTTYGSIVFEDPSPEGQPDGLVVAEF